MFASGSLSTGAAGVCLPVNFHFALKATAVLHCREVTRWAKSSHPDL